MSWLMKRSRPLAKQGVRDAFEGRTENPPVQPWLPWGAGSPCQISGGKMTIGSNVSDQPFVPGPEGGWGNEFMPLTPYWGYDLSLELTGVLSTSSYYSLDMFFGKCWTSNDVASAQRFTLCLQYRHWQTGSKDNRQDNYGWLLTAGDRDSWLDGDESARSFQSTSQSYVTGVKNIRFLAIADKHYVLIVNDIARIAWTIPDTGNWPNYHGAQGKRAVNFRKSGTSLVTATMLDWYAYDWLYPSPNWADIFYDEFNRANGAVGNGWTIFGANNVIRDNAYRLDNPVFPAPSDGGRAILRNTGVTSGYHRIDGIVKEPSAHEQGLILWANSAGTSGLIVRVTATNARLFYWTGAITANQPAWVEIGTTPANPSFASGDVVVFEIKDGNAYVWKNYTELVCFGYQVQQYVTWTNSWSGAYVGRQAFVSSGGWDTVAIKAAA